MDDKERAQSLQSAFLRDLHLPEMIEAATAIRDGKFAKA
jgi:hypothetical protein